VRRAAGLLLTLAIVSTGTTGAAETAPIGRRILDRYGRNLVAITYTLRPREKPAGGEGRKVEEAICGVLLGPEGLIVTSADPFPDPGGDPKTTLAPVEFKVRIAGGRPLDAEAVGMDRDLNIAYLKLQTPPASVRAVDFDEDGEPGVGDPVYVIGILSKEYDYQPVFYSATVNAALSKPRRMYSLDVPLQDLAIGGLVVASSGRAIGIVGEDLLKETPEGNRMPANILSIFGSFTQGRRIGYPMVFPYALFAPQLASPPPLEPETGRSWLGIIMQPLSQDLIDYWKLDVPGGIIISSVVDDSPAQRAGLRTSDIIVALQGEPLHVTLDEDLAGFRRRIERMGVGEPVALTYLRQGEPHDLTVTLGEAPKTAWTAQEYEDEDLGLTVREITMDDLLGQNLEPGTAGVVVSEMEHAGWAQIAGLMAGDIIQSVDGHPVDDLAAFRDQADRLREERPQSVLFFVMRQTETLFVRVRTPWTGPRGRP